MISKIQGVLETLDQDTALIRMDGAAGGHAGSAGNDIGTDQLPGGGRLTYCVLVSPYTASRLSNRVGRPVLLHTIYYIESHNQGASFFPRLLGFLTPSDRQFFELFTTCKGIGYRKALRAMAVSTGQIAAAIADRDADTLESLPEIGKRTAETIIASLRGKIDRFIEYASAQTAAAGDHKVTGSVPDTTDLNEIQRGADPGAAIQGEPGMARQALEVLVQLGENRAQAMAWIDRALRRAEAKPKDFQQLLTAVYRAKSGG